MSMNRRDVIKAGGGAAVYSALASMGFFAANPALASAWKKEWFETKTIADTLKAMGVASAPNSGDISGRGRGRSSWLDWSVRSGAMAATNAFQSALAARS